jgi:hypothetical protein
MTAITDSGRPIEGRSDVCVLESIRDVIDLFTTNGYELIGSNPLTIRKFHSPIAESATAALASMRPTSDRKFGNNRLDP